MGRTLNDYGIEPCTIHNVVCSDFTQEQWLSLATLIDNEYRGSENTFTSEYKNGYYLLDTNKCDYAAMIRVYTNGVGVDKIIILGEHTEGWEEIQKGTYGRIKRSLKRMV